MRSSTRLLLEEYNFDASGPADLPLVPTCPLQLAVRELSEWGWATGALDLTRAADLQLLADALNWAAKVIDEEYYDLKPIAVARARRAGARGGWATDEWGRPVYHLWTAETGESSYHDPHGDLAEALGDDLVSEVWPCGWSGRCRQHLTPALLESRAGADGGMLLREVATVTSAHVQFAA